MNSNLIIFEGYDGAGKSTLIEQLVMRLESKAVRIVGRKSEPRLKLISRAIERPPQPLVPDAEVLLRVALEYERMQLVSECRAQFEWILLDRGPISLMAWADYYNLDFSRYAGVFQFVTRALEGATVIVCRCDFERCWRRILRKGERSKKELMGKRINRLWYDKYYARVEAFRSRENRLFDVDTTGPVGASLATVMSNLKTSCVVR